MNSLKILVVEDEPIIAQDLANTLRKTGHSVVGIAMDYDEAIENLDKRLADLVLLDINIDSEKTGIDLARYIKSNIQVPFIFLTSYSDEATIEEALGENPSGYLVKPIKRSDLTAGIKLAYGNHRQFTQDRIGSYNINDADKKALFIRDKKTLVKVKIEDILYAKAFDNYTYVHIYERSFLISSTLKKVSEKLPSNLFKRTHRSYLVNISKVNKVESGIISIDEHRIPISKGFHNEFMSELNIL